MTMFLHPTAVDPAYLALLEDDVFLAPLIDDFDPRFGARISSPGSRVERRRPDAATSERPAPQLQDDVKAPARP